MSWCFGPEESTASRSPNQAGRKTPRARQTRLRKFETNKGYDLRIPTPSSRALTAGAIALVALIAFIVVGSLIQKRARDRWTVAISDPSMVAIRNLVAKGDLPLATSKLNTAYRFDPE